MYVPNDLNTHLPADKLAENGKGFFQITSIKNPFLLHHFHQITTNLW
jgi:hypothetical protein